ncbi:28 kDa ribonucleoprotein, chloroplastic [Vitis vinifera]|uniref:28 kDa ribonucleoprotein, chloroplastic n=1 Tax=Vitis vinifera TaxID=29760 RepID=A0A438IFF0_VITVI|nr:28 kDa ribonucleoprotein, chloroplastic [Vitis vinifera]
MWTCSPSDHHPNINQTIHLLALVCRTMASASLLSSSSSSSSILCKSTPTAPKRYVSSSLPSSIHFAHPKLSCSISISLSRTRFSTVVAVAAEDINTDDSSPQESKSSVRPCELYVCNLPRSCGISELLSMFKPHGTVQSIEVCRNAETGVSRGSGYVTMSSMREAKAAIAALDGSPQHLSLSLSIKESFTRLSPAVKDVGGREMRVRFSTDMNFRRRNSEALNSAPMRNLIFESPYKLYVGNLAWAIKPEDLRNHFSQFGTVVSARVVHDRKAGKHRAYGFLSFSSAAECEAAMSLNGKEFRGRSLVVSAGMKRVES